MNLLSEDLPSWLNATAWREWCQHRKEIKRRMTPLSVKKQLNLLKNYSLEDQAKVIDNSIRNGWTGLFDLKKELQPKQFKRHASHDIWVAPWDKH